MPELVLELEVPSFLVGIPSDVGSVIHCPFGKISIVEGSGLIGRGKLSISPHSARDSKFSRMRVLIDGRPVRPCGV